MHRLLSLLYNSSWSPSTQLKIANFVLAPSITILLIVFNLKVKQNHSLKDQFSFSNLSITLTPHFQVSIWTFLVLKNYNQGSMVSGIWICNILINIFILVIDMTLLTLAVVISIFFLSLYLKFGGKFQKNQRAGDFFKNGAQKSSKYFYVEVLEIKNWVILIAETVLSSEQCLTSNFE